MKLALNWIHLRGKVINSLKLNVVMIFDVLKNPILFHQEIMIIVLNSC